jgi:hypothetical protein
MKKEPVSKNAELLGTYVKNRRKELRLSSAKDLGDYGKLSDLTVRKIERGLSDSYRKDTLLTIDLCLGWIPGSAEKCLKDGTAPQLSGISSCNFDEVPDDKLKETIEKTASEILWYVKMNDRPKRGNKLPEVPSMSDIESMHVSRNHNCVEGKYKTNTGLEIALTFSMPNELLDRINIFNTSNDMVRSLLSAIKTSIKEKNVQETDARDSIDAPVEGEFEDTPSIERQLRMAAYSHEDEEIPYAE